MTSKSLISRWIDPLHIDDIPSDVTILYINTIMIKQQVSNVYESQNNTNSFSFEFIVLEWSNNHQGTSVKLKGQTITPVWVLLVQPLHFTTNCCGFTLLYNLFTVINLQTSFIVLYIRLAPIEITNCCGFILLYLYYIKPGLEMPKNTERQKQISTKKKKKFYTSLPCL